ncbi:unnamed protein product [Symbiodinium sp. CCMP2592]|nr:unnamed protein product [Symbiodinium sp. CCMP2592]
MPPPPLGMTVAALQGLLNKKLGRPAVYLRKMPADPDWFQTALAMEPSLKEVKFQEVQWPDLLEAAVAAGAVSGRILVNSSEPWSFASAVSLAALHTAIPIDAGVSLKPSLPVLADLRGRWASQVEATQALVWEGVLKNMTTSRIIVQTPQLLSEGFLVDLALKDKMFVMWLDDLCTNGTQGNLLFRQVTDLLSEAGRELSIMGYFAGSEVVADCTSSHSEISLVSDFAPNLAFFSLLPPVQSLKQVPLLPIPKYDPSKIYVALLSSDGDNMQLDYNSLRPRMEERLALCAKDRGSGSSAVCPPVTSPPVGWTISNRLMEFAPTVLRWFFAAANRTRDADSFLMGPSGYGFLHPSSNTKQAILRNLTVEAARKLDMCAYVHWDNYNQEPAVERTVAAYAHTTIRGIFSPVQPAVPPVVAKDIVTFSETKRWFTQDHPEDIAKHLNSLNPGSTVFLYKIHDVAFADVEAMAAALSSNVVLVGHRELIAMMRTHYGLPNGASSSIVV